MRRLFRHNYPLVFVVSVSLMLLVIMYFNGQRAYDDFESYHHELGKNEVLGAANNVSLLLDGMRKSLSLFARDNRTLLQEISVLEDKSIAYDEIITRLDDYFPERLAFSLADQSGFVIVDDIGENVGQPCLLDIKHFAGNKHNTDVYIHSGPTENHIDIMVPWRMMNGEEGVFFVSFKPTSLVKALRTSQALGHNLLIVRTDKDQLIELGVEGARESLTRPDTLDFRERRRINYSVKIPGTRWELLDIFDKNLLKIQRDNIFSQSTFSFITFCLLSIILFLFAKKEEWRRQFAEKELKNTNESLEEIVKLRTQSLLEVNDALKIENSERKKAEEKLSCIARFDDLTELPNRVLLNERLMNIFNNSKLNKQKFSILFLDVDHFKHVNDSFGHGFGDKLLVVLAQRLSLCVRKEDTIARFGGDEFAIIVENVRNENHLSQIAENIIDSMAQSIVIEHQELFVTVSIGIAVFPKDGKTIESLISHADAAMYRSKSIGRNNYAFFTQDMAEQMKRRHLLSNSLQQALSRHEFQVHFQPKIDLFSQEVVGVEALLRWNHPTLGPIKPEEFIPIIEDNGSIIEIGAWVLDKACQFARNRMTEHNSDIPVAVNLSPIQFRDNHLVEKFRKIIEQNYIPASYIEFEVTESLLIQNFDNTSKIINQFRDMGIRITIDDFGTGYASINYLRLLPVNSIKIDTTFLQNIALNKDNADVVRAIIRMAHGLQLSCIAEGVETAEQLAFLKENHCDVGQGFYFSQALPEDECHEWLLRDKVEII